MNRLKVHVWGKHGCAKCKALLDRLSRMDTEGELDIEYHGEVHVGKSQMKSDVGRALGIEHMDWKVITVTSPQVLDIDQFEVVAKEAAKRFGRRLHPRIMGRTPARQIAHDDLSDWMGLSR